MSTANEKETPNTMSTLSKRREQAAARAAKAQAAAEQARADYEAAQAEEERARRARLAEHDRSQVEEWDAQRVLDEVAEARARLDEAALATPFIAALIDYADARNAASRRARQVRDAARRLDIEDEVELGQFMHDVEPVDLSVYFADVRSREVARRREQADAEARAARQAYADDLD